MSGTALLRSAIVQKPQLFPEEVAQCASLHCTFERKQHLVGHWKAPAHTREHMGITPQLLWFRRSLFRWSNDSR